MTIVPLRDFASDCEWLESHEDAVFAALPVACVVLSTELIFCEANPAFLKLSGVTREQLIGRSLFDVFPGNPDDPHDDGPARLAASLGRTLETKAQDAMALQRYDVQDEAGVFRERWWKPVNAPVLDRSGQVTGLLHVVEDVTAEVSAERDRASAGERERLILDAALEYVVLTLDLGGRITSWSPGAKAVLGWSATEAVGRSGAIFFTPEDVAAGVPARELETARDEGCARDERWHLRADGSRVFLDGSVRPLRTPDGDVTGYMKIARDGTERRRQETALRRSEARFRALLENAPLKMWVNAADGAVVFFNAAWRDYTGVDPAVDPDWPKTVHPDDRAALASIRAERILAQEGYELELRVRRSDGAYRWHRSRVTPMRAAPGDDLLWVGASVDIHDMREAQDLQAVLTQEVGHRVKNSLALVTSLLELQARSADPSVAWPLRQAAGRVRSVAGVHDQLWRGGDVRSVDLAPYLDDLCRSLQATSGRVRIRCEAISARVPVDRAVPVAVIVNELATNALKYAYPDGEGEVVVRLSAGREDRLLLEVADRGVGLPPGFDLAAERASLGMRVVRTLARQLNARLTAEGAEPGTRFILEFAPDRPTG